MAKKAEVVAQCDRSVEKQRMQNSDWYLNNCQIKNPQKVESCGCWVSILKPNFNSIYKISKHALYSYSVCCHWNSQTGTEK